MDEKYMKKILIANRAEIACRIIDSVQAAGFDAIAVHSDADAQSLFVSLADASVGIGGQTPAESYLDIEKIINAAKSAEADAIHPGYGFLSENAEFAQACEDNNIKFIGPSPNAIKQMGNKASAKDLMIEAGVPCVPGYQGAVQTNAQLIVEAEKIGAPIMVKAAAGGGGRGMRLVHDLADLAAALDSARSESLSSFGSDELILEKAIIDSRHIEIQIAGDSQGNMIHLGERDCSAQRRHQKVIEECPSPFVHKDLREKMGQAAVSAAKAVQYEGVGTVEFLVDDQQNFYFLEMNTRLQVEHPVTELVTGIDLVDWQIRIASGEPLPCLQEDINFDGHAIEVRIYAEDPLNNFMPQTGKIEYFEPYENEGVRIDHGLHSGCRITPYYDAMLAKLICWGRNREEARRRLIKALTQTRILGLITNKGFLIDLLEEEEFASGDTTTGFVSEQLLEKLRSRENLEQIAVTGALLAQNGMQNRIQSTGRQGGWSNTEPMQIRDKLRIGGVEKTVSSLASASGYEVQVDGNNFKVNIISCIEGTLIYNCNGVSREAVFYLSDDQVSIDFGREILNANIVTYLPEDSSDSASSGQIHASTEGLVVTVLVSEGDKVVKGQPLVVVEAMKMEHRHLADGDGEVLRIAVEAGNQVKNRQMLVELKLTEGDDESA
ncbi:MAG: geranyl-CoA carboxylase alpha subunit [Flavobacterium sp.]|jgi:geranyl-CoA carboxylase alpha subunit